jgi:hypothetical protein
MTVLLQLHPNTEKMRNMLLIVPVSFSIRAEEFEERFWPLVDNF